MEVPSAKPMVVAPSWIERHCVVPDGFRKGEPFRLYDYQLRFISHFYLVRGDAEWVPAHPILAPAFVYRRGLLIGPQKLGKNPLIASQVTLEGVGPALFAGWAGRDEGYVCDEHGCGCGWEYPYDEGEPKGMAWPTPLIQITAFSEDSTENTYDALRPMIEQGPLADIIPRTGEEFIRLPGGGRIDTVTSSNQSRLGQRVTFVPQDELGLWTRQNKMVKVADTQYRNLAGMGGRASLTSNAYDPSEKSVAQLQYESSAPDVYRQFDQPPKNLSYLNKRDRHKIHQAVYPLDTRKESGGHLDLNSIENEAADLVERDAPQAERFYGNRLVAGAGRAVDPGRWDQLADREREVPAGTLIGLGFDGSINRDATVLRGCTIDGHSFKLGLWERPPGVKEWSVPRLEVHQAVHEAFARFRVGLMLCDTPKWQTEIEEWEEKYPGRVLGFDTNVKSKFSKAVDRWLVAIQEGTHTHDGDALTRDHVTSANLEKVKDKDDESDGRNLYILVKGEDKRRIDSAVADVLAFEAAHVMEAPPSIGVGFVPFDPD